MGINILAKAEKDISKFVNQLAKEQSLLIRTMETFDLWIAMLEINDDNFIKQTEESLSIDAEFDWGDGTRCFFDRANKAVKIKSKFGRQIICIQQGGTETFRTTCFSK